MHNSVFAGPKETTLIDEAATDTGANVYPLHRIDRGTSGLILAVDKQAQTQVWMDVIHGENSIREYVAIVRGHLPHTVRVERPIRNDKGEALDALSIIAPLRHSAVERLSLVRARIVTGRRHQVRRHSRSLGHPMLGDTTWGNNRFNREVRERQGVERLCLHAWRVLFVTPSGEAKDLAAYPDATFADYCLRLFDFGEDDWRTLAAQAPLSLKAPYTLGPEDELPLPTTDESCDGIRIGFDFR